MDDKTTRNLLKELPLSKALEILKQVMDQPNPIFLLASRWNENESRQRGGLLDERDYQIERNRIKDATWAFIDELEKDEATQAAALMPAGNKNNQPTPAISVLPSPQSSTLFAVQPEIYVSYAWKDRDELADASREKIVDAFCAACEERGYAVKRDKTTVGYRDSIEAFMHQLGAGKYVLSVISEKYLHSEACMFEAVRMLAHERFEERIFPVVLADAGIFNAEKALDYKIYWRKKKDAFSQKLDEAGRDSAAAEFLLKERSYKEIHERVGEFIARVAKLNVLSPEVHLEHSFAQLFAVLERQMAADGAQANNNKPAASGTSAAPAQAVPFFSKLNLQTLRFEHALRPAQTKWVVGKFPASLNLIGERGQGRHRFMEDLEACGVADACCLVRMKLSAFLTDYDAFLNEIARQANLQAGPFDLVELLRRCAMRQNRPLLFILENPDELYADKPGMDPRFDLGFLQKLNALKNADFATLLLSSYRSVKELTFRGQSSPLWLEVVPLNTLSNEEIRKEIDRRTPQLPEPLAVFIAEQLEFEPNRTHDLLDTLLLSLEGRGSASRDFIGQELKALRQKFVRL